MGTLNNASWVSILGNGKRGHGNVEKKYGKNVYRYVHGMEGI